MYASYDFSPLNLLFCLAAILTVRAGPASETAPLTHSDNETKVGGAAGLAVTRVFEIFKTGRPCLSTALDRRISPREAVQTAASAIGAMVSTIAKRIRI
jgi:hypothetical protein